MKLTDLRKTKQRTITIQQRLIPVGKSMDTIRKYKLLEKDFFVAEHKKDVNELLRRMAKQYVSDKLSTVKYLDFSPLFEMMDEYENTRKAGKDTSAIRDSMFEFRKVLADNIAAVFDVKFESAKTITTLLPEFVKTHLYKEPNYDQLTELAKTIKPYQSRFNIYEKKIDEKLSSKMVKGNIVYRILFDNAEIFHFNHKSCMENQSIYESVLNKEELELVKSEYQDYSFFLYQEEIEKYNNIIGSANMRLNLYCQENGTSYRSISLKKLQNQIFSERRIVIDTITTDKEAIDLYNDFVRTLNHKDKEEALNYITTISARDLSLIYIKGNQLSAYSAKTYGIWHLLDDCLLEYCREYSTGRTIDKREENAKKRAREIKSGPISLEFIESILDRYSYACEKKVTDTKSILDNIQPLFSKFTLAVDGTGSVPLKSKNSMTKNLIKKELEKILDVRQYLNMFELTENETTEIDNTFAESVSELLDDISDSVPIYNKIRNYVNKKPDNRIKTSLTFDSSNFGGGWSRSIEDSKLVSFFEKDGKKYLGIYNKRAEAKVIRGKKIKTTKSVVEYIYDNTTTNSKNCYRKLCLSILGDVKKAIPKNIVYAKDRNAPQHLIEGMKNKLHLTDKKFLEELLEFCINTIKQYDRWSVYNFKFKKASDYESYDEFCEYLQSNDYYMAWCNIEKDIIEELIDNEFLCLFEIYNKDAKKTNNNKSVYTQYLDYFVSEQNVHTLLVKLNGNAEVFYRPAQISDPIIHKKGSLMVNKRDVYGNIVENYPEIVDRIRKGEHVENIKAFRAGNDVIKDRRYTTDQMQIHLTLTIGTDIKSGSINDRVKPILEDKNTNILAVKRGINNLLYAVVINKNNEILYSASLNTINGVNYKELLDNLEAEKKNDQQNWNSVHASDGLKNGYISYAVREVADLMLKYNAVLCLEEISDKIKTKSRINQQVFAKFETAMVKKLSNLADKTLSSDEEGGVIFPYELADESIDIKKTKQNGMILSVPAQYSIGLDQKTGFINRLNFSGNKTVASKKAFMSKLDSFTFDGKQFVVELNYSNFGIKMPKTQWTLTSRGQRIVKETDRTTNKTSCSIVNLTEYLVNIFNTAEIEYKKINLLQVEDKYISVVYKALALVFQMINTGFVDGNYVNFVTSPVSDFKTSLSNSDGTDFNGALTLAKRGVQLVARAQNDENLYVCSEELFLWAQY